MIGSGGILESELDVRDRKDSELFRNRSQRLGARPQAQFFRIRNNRTSSVTESLMAD